MTIHTSTLIEQSSPADLPDIRQLLQSVKLPIAGLEDPPAHAFVARQAGSIVGSAVLERYGQSALLRSVAVAAHLQGQGLGRRLVHRALNAAQEGGIRRVYLLTETAPAFFESLGFRKIRREDVEPAVQQSVEFASACPQSAQAMMIEL